MVVADVFGDLTADLYNRVQRGHRILEDHGHLDAPEIGHVFHWNVEQFFTFELGRARRNDVIAQVESHDGPSQNRLARTGLSDDAKGLAPFEGERHPVDSFHEASCNLEVSFQVCDLKERFV